MALDARSHVQALFWPLLVHPGTIVDVGIDVCFAGDDFLSACVDLLQQHSGVDRIRKLALAAWQTTSASPARLGALLAVVGAQLDELKLHATGDTAALTADAAAAWVAACPALRSLDLAGLVMDGRDLVAALPASAQSLERLTLHCTVAHSMEAVVDALRISCPNLSACVRMLFLLRDAHRCAEESLSLSLHTAFRPCALAAVLHSWPALQSLEIAIYGMTLFARPGFGMASSEAANGAQLGRAPVWQELAQCAERSKLQCLALTNISLDSLDWIGTLCDY
jgi:hypothetical protein